MQPSNILLERILENNQQLQVEHVKKILIIYEEKSFFIGDTCLLFNKLRYVRSFFPNAEVDINFLNKKNMRLYRPILENSPNFDNIRDDEWSDIPFEDYDMLLCITYKELLLLNFLYEKYRHQIRNRQFHLAVFSFSESILAKEPTAEYLFPDYEALREYTVSNSSKVPCELYITNEERMWADQWLESNGMKKGERLCILMDSASEKRKLLNIDVYFDFLAGILKQPNTKVLIFDEKNIGKETFYSEWLGKEAVKNVIFSKQLPFRQDLALISSSYTKMVFGPCTGLMHCASSIYNNLFRKGMPVAEIPLLITYTGEYLGERNSINVWWGNAPLVSCLILKERDNRKEIVLLKDLNPEERKKKDALPCREYTAGMLINLLVTRLLKPSGPTPISVN
ncbi:glycosyltransferase family 9 protein [Chitinophaga sp. S165]|uniref:glycosyltransferase family 9 protein n=1 Tax=Chitinophaga sp. S165 TaxID=2135462 RepID=UPI000D714B29|nr:hypothetical protein [Chitinophaga sp. S165]PWV44508.1 ADP-heptose:LPS heptosyltransferase [Chitinophaga sp. S165]